jgi:hypothetical protein
MLHADRHIEICMVLLYYLETPLIGKLLELQIQCLTEGLHTFSFFESVYFLDLSS